MVECRVSPGSAKSATVRGYESTTVKNKNKTLIKSQDEILKNGIQMMQEILYLLMNSLKRAKDGYINDRIASRGNSLKY